MPQHVGKQALIPPDESAMHYEPTSVLPPAAASLRLYSVTAPATWRPLQQIAKASVFARCWSTMQQFSARRFVQDRKSYQDKIKSPGNFQNKNTLFIFFYTTLTRTTVNFVYVPRSKDIKNSDPNETFNFLSFQLCFKFNVIVFWWFNKCMCFQFGE